MVHPTLNIGIEEEYQLIDPESRELLGYVSQSMARDTLVVRGRDPDFDFAKRVGGAAVEAGTPVCANIKEAREQLLRMRGAILEVAGKNNIRIVGAGTHPFSHWERQAEGMPRFPDLIEDAQLVARRMLAFGLRIHIGVEDRELAVDVMNTMRYMLPHILCLATSSPFWSGHNTGLKSYRSVLLDALPRTGIPGLFKGYQEYRNYVDTLIRTHSIPDASRVWYDIIPHYRFSTLVVRICDMLPDYRDTLALTALIQAAVAWMVELREKNMSFRLYERTLIAENKWLALRYGLDGRLIDFGVEQPAAVRDLIRELLGHIDHLADRLNIRDELAHVHTMLERGSSADQQLRVWRESGQDVRAVVDYLARETENIP
ncbi:MAG: carboxylate-amine ligase [Caldilineaceae bacterium]|nr:carboxylate-amine ligase [Caldilineaceae bacterium]